MKPVYYSFTHSTFSSYLFPSFPSLPPCLSFLFLITQEFGPGPCFILLHNPASPSAGDSVNIYCVQAPVYNVHIQSWQITFVVGVPRDYTAYDVVPILVRGLTL